MRRREFISLLGSALATSPLAARAQQSAIPVIGYFALGSAADFENLTAAFERGVSELGYVKGKNLTIEYRFVGWRPELLPQAINDLIRLNVSVIVALGPDNVAAASKVRTGIPIVGMDLENDPVANGYVESLGRPGGNFTGIFLDIPELSGKQVGLLKEIVPQLSRIAIFGVPVLNALQFAESEKAARMLAVEAELMEVRASGDFEGAIEAAKARRAEAGILLSSPIAYLSSTRIAELALAKRLPLISLFAEFPKAGGLLAYGPDVEDLFRQCGVYVGKVLNGAKPSDLPIQRPAKFDLVINLKTAKTLGVSVPPVLLATADEVIE